MNKTQLIDSVVVKTGIKKKDAEAHTRQQASGFCYRSKRQTGSPKPRGRSTVIVSPFWEKD